MEPRPSFCAYCSAAVTSGADLCETCLLGITKYPEQNAVIVRAYVERGFFQMEHYLGRWAQFRRWEAR